MAAFPSRQSGRSDGRTPGAAPGAEIRAALFSGGDARIALDPVTGLNRYGCAGEPDGGVWAFGSSTASTISSTGYAAAVRLHEALNAPTDASGRADVYARELDRIRNELKAACGAGSGAEVVLAPSGTDLHLIVSDLLSHGARSDLFVVAPAAAETGSGVPNALARRRFGAATPHGGPATEGELLAGGSSSCQVAAFALREPDGAPRPIAAIDGDAEWLAREGAAQGRRVLLVLVDVSKTGMIAPSPALALDLKRSLGERIEVLVDACQFRLSGESLAAYLAHDFLVALTGSKFLTGPTFSGALLAPEAAGARLRGHIPSLALADYSATGEWPNHWAAGQVLSDAPNWGLLLRWEAALEEMRAFRHIPEPQIAAFLTQFATAVEARLEGDPVFEPLARGAMAERPGQPSWDRIPTIFPFLLRHSAPRTFREPFTREETELVYRALKAGVRLDGGRDLRRIELGQPVQCGVRGAAPVSALRICASARLVSEALSRDGGAEQVIGRALKALDAAADTARRISRGQLKTTP